jgi:hypothetical protein
VPSEATDLEQKAPHQRPLLLALGGAAFVVSFDGRLFAPLLPALARDFHIGIAEASWAVSAYMLPYGLCQLAYGPLAERFGKVRVAATAMLAFAGFALASSALGPFPALVALRACTGAAAEALEAALHRALDVVVVEARAPAAHGWHEPAAAGPRHLGGDDHRVARLAGQPLPDDALALARVLGPRRHGVHLRHVGEVDAGVERLVEDAQALGFVGLGAEGHGAETDFGDREAGGTEAASLHGVSPLVATERARVGHERLAY